MTYTQARARLASLWDRVTEDREVVIIHRRGAEDVALISADELAGLLETATLLSSPENARRLLQALGRARRGEGVPQTVESLRQEIGLDEGA
jgi:antitoxin YefM